MKLKRKIEIFEEIKVLLEDNSFTHGICDVIMFLAKNDVISIDEAIKVRELMEVHKPTPDNQYKEFTDSDFWLGDINHHYHPLLGFWWKQLRTNPETRKIRIDYVAKLIDNLK